MTNYRIISLLAASILFGLASVTPAMAISIVPTGLSPGDQYRLAFVTSTTRDALSSNIADYNAFVSSAANSNPDLAALGTTWTAIASTPTVAARDNTGTNPSNAVGVPIYRLDDTLIATNNSDLWDLGILNPISIDETGSSRLTWVYTGTTALGESFSQSLGTVDRVTGFREWVTFGTTSMLTPEFSFWWINVEATSQGGSGSFYGISSPLTVPYATPLPAAVFLFGSAFAGLLGVSWRRRLTSA